jgi:CubicO group peptidase (beta-lactamase class C family)
VERRVDPKRSAAIDRIVAQDIGSATPGLALAVIGEGEVVHLAGYGLAHLAARTPVTPTTQFHIASCGKQFTGLGIMMLREENRLRLDDPIGRHIPELAGFGGEVTLRRLLHHLSGVHDFYDDADFEQNLRALSSRPTNEDLVRLYAMLGCPMSRRSDMFSYNNAGYDLLGCVIERASGRSYRDFFRERVFAPLAMDDTFSLPAARRLKQARAAVGYEKRGGRFKAQSGSALDGICGSGSFYSTAADLCRYENALAANCLVSAGSMRTALMSGVRQSGTPTRYGFGWSLAAEFVEHSGEWTGFVSHIRRYRHRRLSLHALSNNASVSPRDIVAAAARVFYN